MAHLSINNIAKTGTKVVVSGGSLIPPMTYRLSKDGVDIGPIMVAVGLDGSYSATFEPVNWDSFTAYVASSEPKAVSQDYP